MCISGLLSVNKGCRHFFGRQETLMLEIRVRCGGGFKREIEEERKSQMEHQGLE